MSNCIATDSIIPKHSGIVRIEKANVIPVSTTLTFAATEFTVHPTSYMIGNLVTLVMPTITFTGDGTELAVTGTIPGLTPCNVDTFWPVGMTRDGVKVIGRIDLIADSDEVRLQSHVDTNYEDIPFSGSCIVYPVVLQYLTSV